MNNIVGFGNIINWCWISIQYQIRCPKHSEGHLWDASRTFDSQDFQSYYNFTKLPVKTIAEEEKTKKPTIQQICMVGFFYEIWYLFLY